MGDGEEAGAALMVQVWGPELNLDGVPRARVEKMEKDDDRKKWWSLETGQWDKENKAPPSPEQIHNEPPLLGDTDSVQYLDDGQCSALRSPR